MHGMNCNFSHYYCQQAGTGLPIYKGTVPQRGFGIWSNVFKRFGIPLLKYFGKQGLSYASKVGDDVLNKDINIKEALRSNIINTGKTVAFDGLSKAAEKVSQIGTGRRKRRQVTRRKPAPKRKVTKRKAPKKRKTTTKRAAKSPARRRTNQKRTQSIPKAVSRQPIDIFGY